MKDSAKLTRCWCIHGNVARTDGDRNFGKIDCNEHIGKCCSGGTPNGTQDRGTIAFFVSPNW